MNKLLSLIIGLFLSVGVCRGQNTANIKVSEDKYVVAESSADGLPAVIVANAGLRNFKHKKQYGWICSLVITYKNLAMNGMPTMEESDFVFDYIEKLDADIRGCADKPNALFVARITWNGTCEVIWQVSDPERVHEYLGGIIKNKTYPREMDYRIERDEKWKGVSMYTKIKE